MPCQVLTVCKHRSEGILGSYRSAPTDELANSCAGTHFLNLTPSEISSPEHLKERIGSLLNPDWQIQPVETGE